MSTTKPTIPSRRLVFAGAGTAGALAAAAAVLPLARQDQTRASPAAPDTPESGSGYRLTEHVLRYYQTTRV